MGEKKEVAEDNCGAGSWRIGGGGGGVRRAAIRDLPTGAELKPEVLVFEPGGSGF